MLKNLDVCCKFAILNVVNMQSTDVHGTLKNYKNICLKHLTVSTNE